ncbi:hypothetical protein [Caballeronia hypogeia]|nr:hypothetical protein [Caballeronia hypogeia]
MREKEKALEDQGLEILAERGSANKAQKRTIANYEQAIYQKELGNFVV